ncbi:MAG: SDR family NAD(P)-dependent oxidoreductase [Paracoccaceae bacterium]|jgi:NADP-dependent 3-hydroxy acid dehydrogenase YdfG
MFDVTNLHALITGTTSGFGEHFGRFLAGKGARVTLTGRRTERLEDLSNELQIAGAQVQAVQLDVQDQTSVTDCFAQATDGFGCPDIVINNAGITVHGVTT